MFIKFSSGLAGLVLAFGMAFTSGAAASATNVKAFEAVTQVAAVTPLSMRYFCAKNRSECRGGGASEVTLTPNVMAVLKHVNVQVNRAIRPRQDSADVWSLNPTSGDCEDYVLSKRSALVRQGLPASSLRIAYTHTRHGEPHAVLVVRTSQGDYVLDNLNNSVKTLRASGYSIRSMSTANPTQWSAG